MQTYKAVIGFDDSSIHAEVELLNNMAIRQTQFIQNLDNALVRIENKTYGICMITGNLIDKEKAFVGPACYEKYRGKTHWTGDHGTGTESGSPGWKSIAGQLKVKGLETCYQEN